MKPTIESDGCCADVADDGDELGRRLCGWLGRLGVVFGLLAGVMAVAAAGGAMLRIGPLTVIATLAGGAAALAIGLTLRSLQHSAGFELAELRAPRGPVDGKTLAARR